MNLSLRSLETSNLSADNLKNTDYDGSTPKPTMRVILESGYPVLTAVNWPKHCCPICVFSDAPKLDKKYEIEHCSRSSKTINWSAIWSWDTGQWLPRTQTSLFKTCAQRKAGRRQRARRLADLVFKMAGRVMADEYVIFKQVHPCSFYEFWANHCLSTLCVWRGSCFHPTQWTQVS